jgi:hypothetical protein
MSQLINPVSVRDTVLDLKDSCNFAVNKSAQNITSQSYKANSQTPNQLVFAIQVPSLSTVVSRNIIISADLSFRLTGTVSQYAYLWNADAVNQTWNDAVYRAGDTFSPFLLHSLMKNATVQINNTSVVLNDVQRVLDPLLRGLDPKKIQEMYGSTTTQLDYYARLRSALPEGVVSADAIPGNIVPNAGYTARWNSPFNRGSNQNCEALESRNSFIIKSITGNTVGPQGGAVKTVDIVVHIEEPLLLSPYLFGGDIDEPGMAGVTQMNFTFSLDSLATRAIRWINTQAPDKAVTFTGFNDSAQMTLMYYTPQPTQMVPATVITPLQQLVNFQGQAEADLADETTQTFISPSLQLNSVPDKVILWIDDEYKYQAKTTAPTSVPNNIADHYLVIENVNITFGNQTGIMSTFTQKQLYECSRRSGSYQSFDEFTGQIQQSTYLAGVSSSISTVGSVLYLNFGDCVNLSNVYEAPGLLQTTQFQVRVTARNRSGDIVKPRINCMFLYSGILSTSSGNSSSFVNGVITRNDVLNAASAPHVVKKEIKRYLGYGVVDDALSFADSSMPVLKKMLGALDDKYSKAAVAAMDALGVGGAMAGAMAGQQGGLLAGRRSRLSSKLL